MKYKKVLSGHFIVIGNSKKQAYCKTRNVCDMKLFVNCNILRLQMWFGYFTIWNSFLRVRSTHKIKCTWKFLRFSVCNSLTVGIPEGWSTNITVNHGWLPQCVFFKSKALHIFVSYNILWLCTGPLLCAPTFCVIPTWHSFSTAHVNEPLQWCVSEIIHSNRMGVARKLF